MKPEVAVVGAGIVGLATAYSLRERGVDVRVYERGVPGRGQSAGESRIFRHAHADPRLVEMAKRSREVWREWGESLGTELVSADGVVALGDGALALLEVLEGAGDVGAAEIDAAELRERLPLLAGYEGPVVLDRDGGSIRTTAAIGALSSALRESIVAEEVISIRGTAGGATEIRTPNRRDSYDRVVVCAGRGTSALARTAGLSLPIESAAHVRLGFDVAGDPPEVLSCLQDSSGAFPETGIYAAPQPGNRRYAVGLSETTPVAEDGSLVDPDGLESLAERTVAYVREALPGLDPEPADILHCWVTTLPWDEDGVAVWEHDGIHFVAGHNLFKMAPALGRELAAVTDGAELREDLLPGSKLGSGP